MTTETIQKAYCQNPKCGKDLTETGGKVSSSGRIYCYQYSDGPMCIDTEMTLMVQGVIPTDVTFFNYRSPQEIRKLIEGGELTHFSLME